MIFRTQYLQRFAVIAGSITALVGLAQCSPIAPSIDKTLLRGDNNKTTQTQPPTAPESTVLRVTIFRTRETNTEGAEDLITRDLTSAELEEFKATGRIEIPLEGCPVEGIVEAHEVSKADSNHFSIDLKKENGVCSVSVSPKTAAEVSQRVRANIVAISISHLPVGHVHALGVVGQTGVSGPTGATGPTGK